MPLAANALTSQAAVEEVVGAGTYAQARIERLINAISNAFEETCGREFKKATRTESYQGTGDVWLYLRQKPITGVSSVKINGSAVTDYSRDSVSDKRGRLYRVNRWPVSAPPYPDLTQDPDANTKGFNVEVTYEAGYDTIPPALEQACIDEVVRKLVRPVSGTAAERTPGGHSLNWREDIGEFSRETALTLRRFHRDHFA